MDLFEKTIVLLQELNKLVGEFFHLLFGIKKDHVSNYIQNLVQHCCLFRLDKFTSV